MNPYEKAVCVLEGSQTLEEFPKELQEFQCEKLQFSEQENRTIRILILVPILFPSLGSYFFGPEVGVGGLVIYLLCILAVGALGLRKFYRILHSQATRSLNRALLPALTTHDRYEQPLELGRSHFPLKLGDGTSISSRKQLELYFADFYRSSRGWLLPLIANRHRTPSSPLQHVRSIQVFDCSGLQVGGWLLSGPSQGPYIRPLFGIRSH